MSGKHILFFLITGIRLADSDRISLVFAIPIFQQFALPTTLSLSM